MADSTYIQIATSDENGSFIIDTGANKAEQKRMNRIN